MRFLCLVLATVLPHIALSQDYPALHDVVDVAADDVLNIRAAPSGSAAILGSLAHDARGIEVVSATPDGRWGQVNSREMAGWASLRYLARQPGQDDATLPRPRICFGTEPFWTLSLDLSGGAVFDLMGEAPRDLPQETPTYSASHRGKSAFVWSGPALSATGVITRDACNDGMSDRAFGLSVDIVVFPPDAPGTLYSGCCALTAN